jgi:tetratricopeptide (TPR) repeat protein
MELVRGAPITTFCDQSLLDIRQRLELFVDVCSAVQHAHQKGIIHRDLKPSNVLVTVQDVVPVVKVIDFGIAKAVGQKLTDKTLVTHATQVVGTPLYMSPEQAELSGLDVDTRTDIYSLGVLLYELLTGTTPFDRERLQTVPFDELRRIIREEEPVRPSSRVTTLADVAATVAVNRRSDPRRLGRLLRGELDWIVMKCLEKDRARRYETAGGLARDLKRYLTGEAVEACPPSAGYRLRKYAWKHKKALAAVGAFAVLLLAATGVSIGLASWALRERDRARERNQAAEANFQRALEAVDQMLTRVAEGPLTRVPQMEPVRRDLLRNALRFYQDFLRERGDGLVVRSEAARAYTRVGRIQFQLGERNEAEEAFRQAVLLLEQLAAESPDDPTFRQELAGVHNDLALLYHATQRWPECVAALGQAWAVLGQLERQHPTVPTFRYDRARIQNNLIGINRQLGRLDQADTASQEAMALLERLLADDPGNVDYLTLLARCHQNVALVHGARGRFDLAEAASLKALALNDRLVRDHPDVVDHRSRLAQTYSNLGLHYDKSNQYARAEAAYQQALTLKEALVRDHPQVVAFQVDLGGGYDNMAMLVRKARSPEESLAWSARAIRTLEPLLEQDPRYGDARMSLFNAYMSRGLAYLRLGRREEADKDWRRIVELSTGQFHINMRLYRPFPLARLGDHVQATAEIKALLAEGHSQGLNLYNFACVHSLCSAAAANDARLPPGEREKLADRYGRRAVELLRQAAAAGYFREPDRLARLKEVDDLDAVRTRPDFASLLDELEKNAKPQT